MPLGEVHQQSQAVCQSVQDLVEFQRTRDSKLKQSKSGQAPKDMTERQNWIQDKFNFLKTHIRGK